MMAHRRRRGTRWRAVAALVLAAGLVGAGWALVWLGGGATVLGPVQISPAEGYGVVLLRPSRIMRLVHPFMQEPGVAQLVRTDTWRVVRSSGVVDLAGNGRIVWAIAAAGMVTVGADIHWRDIPPLPATPQH